MRTRTEIINKLFSVYGFKSYLEVGVQNPESNFNKINAILKESVDPNLNFKYSYNITSDDFFDNYVGDKKYDVIFIDGLHTEEQSYKDAKNAIRHLNNGGFIVMHDCNPPNEVYTNEQLYCGTVFKTIIKLKHELIDWSCFVVDEDYGCGIITKRNVLENKLLFYEFFDFSWDLFEKYRSGLLQLIPFDEYCNIIVKNNKEIK